MIEYEYSLVVEEYAKKFPKLDIITTVGRKFLFEENLNLIEGAKIIQVQCVFFNNMLIVH
jgi:hypothetical protein